MSRLHAHRTGNTIATVAILLVVALATGAYFMFAGGGSPSESDSTVLLHEVARVDFEAFVTEPGDVASSSNVEIRCRVKSPGSPGTPIRTIVEEGTLVTKEEVLVEFDDSLIQNELLAQKIVVANNKALLTQAESALATAKHTLREFEKGIFQQEVELLESEVFVAEESLRRSEATLSHSKRLAANSFITQSQLNADQFALDKARKDLAVAERKLDVYKRFTHDKVNGEYQSEVKKQEENVEAARYTLELSQQKLAQVQEQADSCIVKAPNDGQVVYANDRSKGDTTEPIEEGTLIRENQVVIRLPDLKNMQVDVKINESHVNRVKPGQPAEILLDADPDTVLRGRVEEVAPYPFPIRWHGAPLEYGCVVTIVDPPPTIRPGLRAKVKIVFDSQQDVLQVPLAAVIEQDHHHYCLVRDGTDWQLQRIKIGTNNNDQAVVISGLDEGDQVSLTPFRFIERADLPDSESPREPGEKQVATDN